VINPHNNLERKPEERDHLEALDVHGRIILRLVLKNCWLRVWKSFDWLRGGLL
jgi:hypothetical protein